MRHCARLKPSRVSCCAEPGRRTTISDDRIEAAIAKLLERPYLKTIRGDPVNGYLTTAPELPGCITAGETEEEALLLLRDAVAGWFETALAHGWKIPEPSKEPLTKPGHP